MGNSLFQRAQQSMTKGDLLFLPPPHLPFSGVAPKTAGSRGKPPPGRRKGPFVQVEPKNRSSWWAPCGCCPSKKRRDGEVCEASVLSSSCLLSSAQPGPGLGSPVSQAALGSRSCSPPNGLFSCQVPPAHRQQPGLPPHRQHRSQEAVPHGGHGLLLHHVLCLGKSSFPLTLLAKNSHS